MTPNARCLMSGHWNAIGPSDDGEASSGPFSTAPAHVKGGLDQAIGRSQGGLTTKIHAVVDALGNPTALSLTGVQAHDITQAKALTAQVRPAIVLVDKGYASDAVRHSLKIRAITDVIPPKSNRIGKRGCDFSPYRQRNLVESFFNTSRHLRRNVPRCEKTASNVRAALHLRALLA